MRWLRETTHVVLTLLGIVGPISVSAQPAPVTPDLESLIRSAEQAGHRLFYSSDLVRPSMRVESPPGPANALESLAVALPGHGLALRRGLDDSWLIVRAPEQPAQRERSGPGTREPPAAGIDRLPIEEVIVSASQYEIRRARTPPSFQLRDYALERLPSVGDDALRATTRLPGMASTGWSALGHVRGGEINETLVRLDGLRLYEPFHMKDFKRVFSAIDPRIVDSMDVFTGGFPAGFGDRMSGVIDVDTIEADELHHELGFSFFNTNFLSAGTFADSRADWLVSLRRSNLDLLYDKFSDQPERPRYVDSFAKLGFELTDRLRLTGNVLRIEDDISLADDIDREERAISTQVDSYAWIRLDHSIDGIWSGSTRLAKTSLASDRTGSTDKAGLSHGDLTDHRRFSIATLETEWSRVLGRRMLLDFGGTLSSARGTYVYRDDVAYDLLFDIDGAAGDRQRSRSVSLRPRARRAGLFATLRVDWTERFTSELGLRLDSQRIGDRRDDMLGTRFGARYELGGGGIVRFSAGRFVQPQAINELDVSDGITRYHAPQRTDHRVVGYERALGPALALRLELYVKTMRDLKPRFENFLNPRVLLPELKPDRISITPLSARSRGVEIGLDGEKANVRWWTILSLASVDDRFETDEIPRSWDQTWSLGAGFLFETDKWSFSSAAAVREGWPVTPVALDDTAVAPTALVGRRNSERFRDFASLDVRLARHFALQDTRLTASLELNNATSRRNACCVEYELGEESEAGELTLDDRYYLPAIPSLGVLWEF